MLARGADFVQSDDIALFIVARDGDDDFARFVFCILIESIVVGYVTTRRGGRKRLSVHGGLVGKSFQSHGCFFNVQIRIVVRNRIVVRRQSAHGDCKRTCVFLGEIVACKGKRALQGGCVVTVYETAIIRNEICVFTKHDMQRICVDTDV